MCGKNVFVLLSTIVVLGGGLDSAFASGHEVKGSREGGWVAPCSLVGVNPVFHPEIFGNPAVARSYGFVRSRDGAWQVAANCHR